MNMYLHNVLCNILVMGRLASSFNERNYNTEVMNFQKLLNIENFKVSCRVNQSKGFTYLAFYCIVCNVVDQH